MYEGDPSAWKAKTKDFPVCIRYIDVSCLFQPPEAARGKRYTTEVAKDMTKERVGYRTMCLFWSSLIFKIPAIAKLESYLRLDTDSIFLSDVDVFQRFHASPNVYGCMCFSSTCTFDGRDKIPRLTSMCALPQIFDSHGTTLAYLRGFVQLPRNSLPTRLSIITCRRISASTQTRRRVSARILSL